MLPTENYQVLEPSGRFHELDFWGAVGRVVGAVGRVDRMNVSLTLWSVAPDVNKHDGQSIEARTCKTYVQDVRARRTCKTAQL